MSDPPAETCDLLARPVEAPLPGRSAFKGSGFYSTDYGSRKSKAKDAETSSSGEKSSDKSSEKPSTESKPRPASDSGD
jgi:predicted nucleic acid-binding Zn ribbon protein